MSNPHDRLVKAIFGDPRYAAQHLAERLPAEIVARLDLTQIKRVDRSFVDEELSERHADLLFCVGLKEGGAVFVYMLFEHQSTPDPLMAYRLLVYMLRFWERWRADNPRSKRLPLVYPMLLYNGEAPWRAPRDLAELIELPSGAGEAFAGSLPHLTYHLIDLSTIDDDALTGGAVVALVQLLLKHHAKGDLIERLGLWRATLRRAAAEGGSRAVELVVKYILEVHARPDTVPALRRVAVEALGESAKETVMTTADRLRDEGRLVGLERGLEQGLERGLEQGRRQEAERLLLRLLRLRYDAPTEAELARIQAAELHTLESWMERIFAARSVADVLSP